MDWPAYRGSVAGTQYSALEQINTKNVKDLEQVWQFTSAEAGDPQTSPLIIDGTLFAFTPGLEVIALDAASGTLRWKFDAGLRGVDIGDGKTFTGPSRGLTLWKDGTQQRLFAGVMNFLYALDLDSGSPIPGFGNEGAIDLRKGLRGDHTRHYVALTSPGVVYKDLLIVGFRTSENPPAPPGDIRAYDARTGALRWTFHTIPQKGEPGSESWPEGARSTAGGSNNWAGLTLDQERGIVYAPTGSAVPDFYGGDRPGDNLYANSLLALDAETGKLLWHYQIAHHDIWDRDLPTAPSLATVSRNGEPVPAVVQPTKHGYLFIFDRVTGRPLFRIEERAVPASSLPGERTAVTQPFPILPEPFARQRLTADMLTTRTPEAAAWALRQFDTFISDGQFVPLTLDRQTVVFPGFDGGAEWGGAAVDPQSGVLYVNANDIAWTGGLVERTASGEPAAQLYEAQCAVCHGIDRQGSPPAFPSLDNLDARLTKTELSAVIQNGRGRMPPFTAIPSEDLERLIDWLRTPLPVSASSAAPADEAATDAKQEMVSLSGGGLTSKYRFTGYRKFLDPDGYPAVAPPWGTLNAIDLHTGEYLWRIPLGEYPELAKRGVPSTGSENYGGPVVTAGGLVFIAATIFDRRIRAFDSRTGALLWSAELPYAGTATPSTYMIDGRQYLVIATSNARNPKAPQGSAYVAFALPR